MRAKIAIILAAGLLTMMAGMPGATAQEAPKLRDSTPAQLYQALIDSTFGVRCDPIGDYSAQITDRLLDARFRKVRPWLIAEVGQPQLDAMDRELDEAMGTVDFYGCPSDLYQKRQTRRRRDVLREMERRAHKSR
jgi:hypothetical protein